MFARVTENQSETTAESIKPFINDRLGWLRYLPHEKREKYEILQHSLSIAKSNTRGSVKIDGQIQFDNTTPRDNNEAVDNSIHVIRKILHQKEYLELDSLRIDVGNKRRSFKLENLVIHKSLFATQQAKKIVQGEVSSIDFASVPADPSISVPSQLSCIDLRLLIGTYHGAVD